MSFTIGYGNNVFTLDICPVYKNGDVDMRQTMRHLKSVVGEGATIRPNF